MAKAKTVTRVGNLAAEPELKWGQEGKKVYCRMRIAVERPKVPGDWKGERETVWYTVTCFDSLAEHCAESLHKGQRIIAYGKPEWNEWTGEDGEKRSEARIIAQSIGPDLRWQTAEIAKGNRRAGDQAMFDEEDEDF